jgi:hypothetical protein
MAGICKTDAHAKVFPQTDEHTQTTRASANIHLHTYNNNRIVYIFTYVRMLTNVQIHMHTHIQQQARTPPAERIHSIDCDPPRVRSGWDAPTVVALVCMIVRSVMLEAGQRRAAVMSVEALLVRPYEEIACRATAHSLSRRDVDVGCAGNGHRHVGRGAIRADRTESCGCFVGVGAVGTDRAVGRGHSSRQRTEFSDGTCETGSGQEGAACVGIELARWARHRCRQPICRCNTLPQGMSTGPSSSRVDNRTPGYTASWCCFVPGNRTQPYRRWPPHPFERHCNYQQFATVSVQSYKPASKITLVESRPYIHEKSYKALVLLL